MDNNNSSYQNSTSYSSSFSLNPNANWSSMNANWSSNNPFSYNYNNSTNLSLEPQSPSRSSITDSNTHRNNNNYTHNQSIFSDQFFNSKSPLDSLPSNKSFDNSSINFNRLSCSNSQKLWPDFESSASLAPDAHWGLVFPVQLGAGTGTGKSLAWPRQSPVASGPSLDHHYPQKSIRQFTQSIDNSPPFDYYAILAQKTVDKPDLNGFNSSSITNHNNHNHSTNNNNNNNSDNVIINPINNGGCVVANNDPTSSHDSSNQSPKSIIVRPANSQQSNPAPPSSIVTTQSSAHLNMETLDRSLSSVGLVDHHHPIPVSVVVGPSPPSKKTWAVIVGKQQQQQQQQQQQRHHNHQPQSSTSCSSHSNYSPMRLPTAAGPHKPDFLIKKPLATADANHKSPAGSGLDVDCQNIKSGRFFVIKSYSEDDVYRSIKYRIWCSTETGNRRLDSAWSQSVSAGGAGPGPADVPIYLFFSVNGSGHFCGVAEMAGPVDYKARASVWSQGKWKGQFPVRWLCVKDVPNSQLRHIRIETNENKPVTNSRDVTEIPLDKGRQVMKIIANFKASSSIYDDFDHYEQRELSESNQ